MPNLTGRQVAAILLRRAGQGLGQYFDQKQLAEQREIERKNREWVDRQRKRTDVRFEQGQEDRQRALDRFNIEQQSQQRAQSFLKILGGDSPFAPEIPDVNIQRQKAFDITGRTAPATVQAGAFGEDLVGAGVPSDIAGMAVLKKLGIAPKAPKAQTERQKWAALSLNPNRNPLEELEYQSLDKTYGSDKKAQAEAKKQRKQIKTDQIKWDKDVRAHVLRNAVAYPQTAELLNETGRFSIGYRLKPESWSDKDWNLYKFEQVKINRFMGRRPVVTEFDVDLGAMEKLRSKYSEEEIQQALQ
jgi:hypothetical protein